MFTYSHVIYSTVARFEGERFLNVSLKMTTSLKLVSSLWPLPHSDIPWYRFITDLSHWVKHHEYKIPHPPEVFVLFFTTSSLFPSRSPTLPSSSCPTTTEGHPSFPIANWEYACIFIVYTLRYLRSLFPAFWHNSERLQSGCLPTPIPNSPLLSASKDVWEPDSCSISYSSVPLSSQPEWVVLSPPPRSRGMFFVGSVNLTHMYFFSTSDQKFSISNRQIKKPHRQKLSPYLYFIFFRFSSRASKSNFAPY